MPRVVPAVARALEILDLLQDFSTISVPEICNRLGLPRSTAHELVSTLAKQGFLAPAENLPHRFTLGVKLFELGSAYSAGLDLVREGAAVTREIAETCDETAQLGVLDGNEVVYVVKADSTRPVRLVAAVGSRLPAHVTAHGKVLLTGLSDEEVATRFGGSATLPGLTPNSITAMSQLLYELSRVRREGVAFDDCESNSDLWGVAAPVHNQHHCMAAAIGVAIPVTRMNAAKQAQLTELVKKAGCELSLRLGYRAAPSPAPEPPKATSGLPATAA